MPPTSTATPEATVAKLLEIAEGIKTGRTRFVVCVYCLEGDPNTLRQMPSGIFAAVPNAEGGFVRCQRNDADPKEVERCVRETAQVLTREIGKVELVVQ